jgi:hypothetical protein
MHELVRAKTAKKKKKKRLKETVNNYERLGRSKPSSVVKPSLSLSDSDLMMGKKCGLPGRMLKLTLDEKPVEPSS